MDPAQIVNIVPYQNRGRPPLTRQKKVSLTDGESGYQVLLNSDIQISLPQVRETSGSTLLNASETDSQGPLPQAISHQSEISSENSDARLSSRSGNDDVAWETVVDAMETRHTNDITDLKEEHEVEVTEYKEKIEHLKGQLERAKERKNKTQVRVNGLLQGHADLQAQVDASDKARQQVTSDFQALEIQYDQLNEKYEKFLVPNGTVQFPSTQPTEEEVTARCQVHEHTSLEQDLIQSQEVSRALARDLNNALDENRRRCNEVRNLRWALEDHPEYDIGLQAVVDYQEKTLKDLQATSNQCSLELDKLQKESAHNKDLADAEIFSLNAQLTEKNSLVSQLRTSTNEYKQVSENILAMLQKKAYPNDLIQAMESYYQAAISDNDALTVSIKRREEQIDEMTGQINKLRADLLHEKRSSDEKDDLCRQNEQDIFDKKNTIEDVQTRLEMAEGDLERLVEERDVSLAEAEGRFMMVTGYLEQMVNGAIDDGARAYIVRRTQEADQATSLYHQACEQNNQLRQLAEQREAQASELLKDAVKDDLRLEQVRARLEEAEKEVNTLRDEIRGLRQLPLAVDVSRQMQDQPEVPENEEAQQPEVPPTDDANEEEEWDGAFF